ncbi:type III secretion system chaperone [Burkholderia ubonensis]|uniref:type III secretion system chaperone n=1 Tax=Burkholderia ubonensis TaxID=101571 RepID=UPI000AA92D2C|nr:type III secretion system chaperone [Burkholderia ubonensis]
MTLTKQYNLLINEWMGNLGLPKNYDDENKLLVLNVDDRFDIRCCFMDSGKIIFIAEWPMQVSSKQVLVWALEANRPVSSEMQPVIALRDGKRWQCWLDLPLVGCDLSTLHQAFTAVVRRVEWMRNDAGVDTRTHNMQFV